MAALRIARPGEPVRVIDLGPARGRVTGQHGATRGLGGEYVQGRSPRDRELEMQRAAMARLRETRR